MNTAGIYLIPLFFMVSASGLAWVIARALQSGAQNYSDEYAEDTARQFEDLFLFIPPERINQVAWAAAAMAFVLVFSLTGGLSTAVAFFRGIALALAAALGVLFAPQQLVAIMKQRRVLRFNNQLVDELVHMSNALRAGFSISQAFESVVKDGLNPISQEFAVMLHQTRVGMRFEDALVSLEKRVNSEDLTLMIRAIEVARLTGGNLTEVFDKIASTIRERMRIEGRIRSLTAQGRLQGIVVGLMPILLGLAVYTIDPRMMGTFLSSNWGLVILVVVAALELAGMLVIRKIVRIQV